MDKDVYKRQHECRVDYMHIKRTITSLREEFVNLLHNTNKLIEEENIVYYNDFDDRMRSILGNLASFHESLTSLLDLYYNNNNLKMNDIIKLSLIHIFSIQQALYKLIASHLH